MMNEKRQRNPILAAILSFLVPGLGQIYDGEWRRGIAFLIGLSAQAGLFFGVGMQFLSYFLIPVWLWIAWDAWSIAQSKNASPIAPIILVILLNVIAAWVVTQVQSPSLQPEQRKAIFGIIRGIGTPDFFAKNAEETKATAKYIVPGPGAPESIEIKPPKKNEPYISLSPIKNALDSKITVSGSNFAPKQTGRLILLGADEYEVGTFTTDSKGSFKSTFINPRYIPGDYFVQARMEVQTGGWSFSKTLTDAAPRLFETLYLALMGTAFSMLFAIPLSFLGARNLMSGSSFLKLIYGVIRGLFTALRSVEVLIIAVIAVAAVGVGPFAGVLALAIHGVGAMGKLYSEAIESIDHRPIEAIRSTGANDLQVVIFAVVPQVVPQFIAFTLYRWDINVRMATVIGLVGGGGIGAQLYQYMGLLQWRQAATAIWLIAGVVMLMDYASAVIREKIV